MKIILPILLMLNTVPLFNFDKDCEINKWQIVNDVVMGGRSDAEFFLNEDQNAVFQGHVSTRNNGGFASVRYRFPEKSTTDFTKFCLTIKGDGARYQFRVKEKEGDRHSYISYFETTGEMQQIEIDFAKMYPTFRGRELNMPNFSGDQMVEIAFLIGNKKEQDFRLVIDKIELK